MAHLLVSLSGLTDDLAARAGHLADALDQRGVPLTLLVRPCGPDGPLRPGGLVDWLRHRREGGDALVLHGFDHTADPTAARNPIALGRRAEFAALPRHEAGLRLTAARRVLTGVGLRTDSFAPPRWSASPGTVAALTEQGFAVLADEAGVRRLDGAAPPLRGRVLGLRSRSAADVRGPRRLAADATRAARRGEAVRIDVRAVDLGYADRFAAVLAAVDAARAAGAVPADYRLPAAARAA
ncbi:DUF2334 domain-containing protein [Pseudonocardia humida]|uniref:DUF2334 domain-containing protein n=1 Tax=Pseudonocardia humida TaxID=2800819 RepID=A0ABT1A8C1_9PSEU|nr:DUF2334 domain-containing protein [Pseudonocardia humida]MCO1659275.1 DUF2334 domain-containing protein [Pseudonocardia humida]